MFARVKMKCSNSKTCENHTPTTSERDNHLGSEEGRAKFGVKMFARARDTAVNVIYYAMGGSGSFLRTLIIIIQHRLDNFGFAVITQVQNLGFRRE